MKKIIKLLFCALFPTLFISCSGSAGYVDTEPTYVEVERPVQPYPDYIWVNDGWDWRNNTYIHRNGYWSPPRANRTYVGGYWVKGKRGLHWKDGKWR